MYIVTPHNHFTSSTDPHLGLKKWKVWHFKPLCDNKGLGRGLWIMGGVYTGYIILYCVFCFLFTYASPIFHFLFTCVELVDRFVNIHACTCMYVCIYVNYMHLSWFRRCTLQNLVKMFWKLRMWTSGSLSYSPLFCFCYLCPVQSMTSLLLPLLWWIKKRCMHMDLAQAGWQQIW